MADNIQQDDATQSSSYNEGGIDIEALAIEDALEHPDAKAEKKPFFEVVEEELEKEELSHHDINKAEKGTNFHSFNDSEESRRAKVFGGENHVAQAGTIRTSHSDSSSGGSGHREKQEKKAQEHFKEVIAHSMMHDAIAHSATHTPAEPPLPSPYIIKITPPPPEQNTSAITNTGFWNTACSYVTNTGENLWNRAEQGFDDLIDGGKKIIHAGLDKVQGAWNYVTDTDNGLVHDVVVAKDKAVNYLTEKSSQVMDALGDTTDAVTGYAVETVHDLEDNAKAALHTVSQNFDSASQKVGEVTDVVCDAVTGTCKKVTDWIWGSDDDEPTQKNDIKQVTLADDNTYSLKKDFNPSATGLTKPAVSSPEAEVKPTPQEPENDTPWYNPFNW